MDKTCREWEKEQGHRGAVRREGPGMGRGCSRDALGMLQGCSKDALQPSPGRGALQGPAHLPVGAAEVTANTDRNWAALLQENSSSFGCTAGIHQLL